MQTSGRPDVGDIRTSGCQDVMRTFAGHVRRSGSQTARTLGRLNPDVRTTECPNIWTSGRPDIQTSGRPARERMRLVKKKIGHLEKHIEMIRDDSRHKNVSKSLFETYFLSQIISRSPETFFQITGLFLTGLIRFQFFPWCDSHCLLV